MGRAGEWWEKDLAKVDRNMTNGFFDDYSSGSTINGKLGDLFNCSGNYKSLLITHALRRKRHSLFNLSENGVVQ
jgi:hypothetical protein